MNYDVLVVGGGIAGMESALTLGDMGLKALLIEKEPSIGGKMILLSKVFPTLDCASCISTPKMASTIHHSNVTVMTSSETREITKNPDGSFKALINRRSTYVDNNACTGCGECELACTVALPDRFNFDMVAHRAAYIPFPQAVPKKAVISRQGQSPCSNVCPAGVKAHGYVSLVRSGKYDEAFHLHMEDAPLPGSLSRACYAPCENACTRGDLEGPVDIRRIKRFMVDHYYSAHSEPEYGVPEKLLDKRIAIVGSGPAGLSAAYHLGRKGYQIKIFEREAMAGGMLRYAIPAFRLPKDIVDRDIKNITVLGVEIETNTNITSTTTLMEQGFDAVFLAVGTYETWKMQLPGEDLDGVMDCMGFLSKANTGNISDLSGKTVIVVGGGNSAIDPARLALRMGAEKVIILYRRTRKEMPAHEWEIQAAIDEGAELMILKTPRRFIGNDGRLVKVEVLKMELGEPDDSGRRRPVPVKGSEHTIDVDLAVLAIGLRPRTDSFANQLKINRDETFRVNPETLESSIPSVFAGGDGVTGPAMIVDAIGQGKRAAFYINRYLQDESLEDIEFDSRLSVADKSDVLNNRGAISKREQIVAVEPPPSQAIKTSEEIETCMTEEEARYSANRCLDCADCSECGECIKACPADAIHFDLQPEELEIEANSVIVSTGFKLFDAHLKTTYGYGKYPNVVTAMQMDRLVSPTKPFNKTMRPSDGKAPDNIAFVLCTGSRDCTIGNSLCSRVCCMYSIKQAQLLMGALPLADITIYYMDIRAFGKGYEEFYQEAKEMGVYFVKGRVAKIEPAEDGNLSVFYEDIDAGSGHQQMEHDLVVLSVGLLPNMDALNLFKNGDRLEADAYSYVKEINEDIEPTRTSIDGVFAAGTSSAARDIPDSILHAGAAAAQAAGYIHQLKANR
ncbi:MAG: FAD-dependent oxidoreductase [Calditrichaeota bacterium]|nr:FAD-dependent oxidoreductase [Calditrichota bacterium]